MTLTWFNIALSLVNVGFAITNVRQAQKNVEFAEYMANRARDLLKVTAS